MAAISVTSSQNANGWSFGVQVAEPDGQTRHSVTLSTDEFKRLTVGKQTTPEQLIRKSFEFLLEQGPKRHILRQFDLSAISRLFPDYPAHILTRL